MVLGALALSGCGSSTKPAGAAPAPSLSVSATAPAGPAPVASAVAQTPAATSLYSNAPVSVTTNVGWTYQLTAQLSTPSLTLTKDVSTSPPGRAQLVMTLVVPERYTRATGATPGRTAPPTDFYAPYLYFPFVKPAVTTAGPTPVTNRQDPDCAPDDATILDEGSVPATRTPKNGGFFCHLGDKSSPLAAIPFS